MNESAPTPTLLADYAPPPYGIDSVDLTFDLAPTGTRVSSRLRVRRRDGTAPGTALRLDGDELRLVSIGLDGTPLDHGAYALDAVGLTIADPPAAFTLDIVTEIDPDANTRLEGLYRSNALYCTQCEAEGFRRITFFPDRPDVLARYSVTIRADRENCPVLLSNGNRIEAGALPDGRHFTVWQDPFPKPSYLFALVAGDLATVEDSFTTASGRAVRLAIHVEHGNEVRCGYAMDALKRAMAWDERRYGLEYDLDLFNIVAVSHFNMGAMENKSLNIFNAKYVLADPETATDDDYAFIESIVAHEYFHNWTGNRVTCRDWFQLSLKEGLTVFRDRQFSADMRSASVARIQDVRDLRASQFPEDAGPLAHPVRPDRYVEINNFYTATVYEKGAEVIAMLHRLLGEAGFRAGIDLYLQRHDGAAATCDDSIAAMRDANDADIDFETFMLWYSQAGTPELRWRADYDADSRTLDLEIAQTVPATPGQDDKRAMLIPLDFGFLGPDGAPLSARLDGEDAAARSWRPTLAGPRARLRFHDVAAAPIVSFNRGFAAPVKTEGVEDLAARALRIAHDPDPFNRWDAAQQAAADQLLTAVAAVQAGNEPAFDARLIDAYAAALRNDDLDMAFRAELLRLPSEGDLAERMEIVDVETIHEARQALRARIGADLGDLWRETHERLNVNLPFDASAEAAGRRALRNLALAYLTARDGPGDRERLDASYHGATSMTDRIAALRLLVDCDDPARERALSDFRQRFAGNANVIDKWFSLQAMSARPGTVGKLERLAGDDEFTWTNPNRVRALVGAFAMGNPLRFHAADGSGYRFLAAALDRLDPINPQVAARIATAFGRWRRFDASRQAAMCAVLRDLAGRDTLSRDLRDIVARSLA